MDWRMILSIAICLTAIGVAAASVWKVYEIKKEAYLFEGQVEQALDDIIARQVFFDRHQQVI